MNCLRYLVPNRGRFGAILSGLLLSACASHLTTGGGARVEQLAPTAGPSQTGLRAEARATLAVPLRRGSLAVMAAPSALLPMNAATTARAQFRTGVVLAGDVRARLRPVITMAQEQGTTTASEMLAEDPNAPSSVPIDPRPNTPTLTSQRRTSEATLEWQRSARHALSLGLSLERSAGRGASAAALPSLQREVLRLQSSWRANGRTTWGFSAAAERSGVASAVPWATITAETQWTRRQARGLTLALELGGVASEAGAASRIGARLQRAAAPSRMGLDLVLAQGPELDRIDGSVRPRQRVRVSFETPRVSAVSFRGGLQAFADRGVKTPRRAVGFDVALQQRLGDTSSLEISVARLLLWEGHGAARGETRLSAGLRIPQPAGRCRSSC